MTEAVFQAPKRRARVYESYEGPFPVPLCADGAGGPEPLVYRADVVNRHVVVRDPAHIGAVYGKGYFGKGVLSRSKPQHSISERFQRFGDQRLPVISSSKYEQHVNWARELLLAQGLDEDVVDEMLQKCVQPVPEVGVEEEEEEGEGQEGVTCSEDRSASTGPLPPCGLSDGERPKPRRQGDPRYDPLAELHERMDRETVDGTHFSRHDGRVEQEDRRCPLPSAGCQYVLVEEEAERHEQAALETNGHRSGVRLVCRINPFQVIEYLQLSPEEAFFLVYALGCLSIYYNEEPLTIANLWEMFCSAQPNFDTTYAAYHYFRSKGWVPKTGVKYGTDFCESPRKRICPPLCLLSGNTRSAVPERTSLLPRKLLGGGGEGGRLIPRSDPAPVHLALPCCPQQDHWQCVQRAHALLRDQPSGPERRGAPFTRVHEEAQSPGDHREQMGVLQGAHRTGGNMMQHI
ncbi:tRNA-splicing endonuclease subunit Sen2 isoform X2 [Scleropages formosus]|uniref:tRNA-splicing endonuclease subunit Sen2 isoform X2 n=1 Tax=Scleropages formosus TaxID=113540 RepID=UPI000878803C|nr:tRNA-splicing endonuclease subunit Sen2 isoform X2 [Scleropages formosus]